MVSFLVVYWGHGIVIFGWNRTHAGQERQQLSASESWRKDYKRSDSGGLFMLVTKTGSKLWRYAYSFDAKRKLLAIGQYPLVSLADARTKRDNAKRLAG
jgi:hypothetical protein